MTLQQAQWMTASVIAILTAVAIGYDVWVYHAFGSDATISRVIGFTIRRHPIIGLGGATWVGILIGHFCLNAG